MFGGLATAPVNSPHLRKSGSRAVVSDFGIRLIFFLKNYYIFNYLCIGG